MRMTRVSAGLVAAATVVVVLATGPAVAVAANSSTSTGTVLGTRVHVMPYGVHATHHGLRAGAAATFPAPPGAHLTYYGGRVVSTLQAVDVLYGSGTYESFVSETTSPNMGTFLAGSLNSGLLDWLDGEYNTVTPSDTGSNQHIGRGTYAGKHQITPSPANDGSTIQDSQVQAELAAQIQAGTLPAPVHDAAGNNNTDYILYFPAGTRICQGGACSMVSGGFCAYHGTIANIAGYGEVYYTVMPDFTGVTGCGTAGTDFGNETSALSHEFMETITDAEVGIATTTGPPLAWYDTANGEIGDICNAEQGTITGADGLPYTVQAEFSNAQNACILPPTWANDFSLTASPASVRAPVGRQGTTTISTTLLSGNAQSISLSVSGLPAGATETSAPVAVTSGGSTSLTLDAGTAQVGTYPVTVTATSSSGATHSTLVSLTVVAPVVPDAPSGVGAAAGQGAATVSWSAPAFDGGSAVTGYTATASPGGATCRSAAAVTSCTVAGLRNGTAYAFTVTASNAVGTSVPSAASSPVTPTGAPDAPSGTSARAGAGSATVSWSVPSSDGGSTVTSYLVTASPGGATCTTAAPVTSCVVSGLTGGTAYTFTVTATNGVATSGPSVASAPVSPAAVDLTAPTASVGALPVGTVAASVRVTWSGADAGSGVAGYDVRYRTAAWNAAGFGAWVLPAAWQHTTARSATLALAAGVDYCVSVRARDLAGNVSGWSVPRCVARALDDRSMVAGAGWTRSPGTSYYLRTITASSTVGRVLTRSGARLDRVGIVATRCATCGIVGVYVGVTLIGEINLASAPTRRQQLVMLGPFSARLGTVTIKTLTAGKLVQVDGLLISRT